MIRQMGISPGIMNFYTLCTTVYGLNHPTITSQRYPTQINPTFMYTKSADLYRATICWLFMRESEKFFEVGRIKINKCQRL